MWLTRKKRQTAPGTLYSSRGPGPVCWTWWSMCWSPTFPWTSPTIREKRPGRNAAHHPGGTPHFAFFGRPRGTELVHETLLCQLYSTTRVFLFTWPILPLSVRTGMCNAAGFGLGSTWFLPALPGAPIFDPPKCPRFQIFHFLSDFPLIFFVLGDFVSKRSQNSKKKTKEQ